MEDKIPSFELKYADMAANVDFIRLVFSNILGHLLSFSKDKNLNMIFSTVQFS